GQNEKVMVHGTLRMKRLKFLVKVNTEHRIPFCERKRGTCRLINFHAAVKKDYVKVFGQDLSFWSSHRLKNGHFKGSTGASERDDVTTKAGNFNTYKTTV
ncbi:Hypothetical predicted protein, partial [Mytilus galloprovincialis]